MQKEEAERIAAKMWMLAERWMPSFAQEDFNKLLEALLSASPKWPDTTNSEVTNAAYKAVHDIDYGNALDERIDSFKAGVRWLIEQMKGKV